MKKQSAAPDGGGLRYDDEKPRYDLIPPDALHALAVHYTISLKKYPERNWERGMAWGKCFASLMRHAWAWMRGEDFDPETGSHHMIAAAWNALAIATYHMRGIGNDDRPGFNKEKPCFTTSLPHTQNTRAAWMLLIRWPWTLRQKLWGWAIRSIPRLFTATP
ncbi:hypothetical protein Aam_030_062 [Acidocella aminolytica 101 = DSM 11237]|uniref:dATP/dGTP diphosphohydrolase N-terminal domain-containing protein n=1 Tax=Acidocella aminolytica 101 = DSM 11237 TaxID=1120923 RepID=A0A0D6PG57_9PROT|nr:hypothetical protein Aam_030_062 [Acidocella aminolytica 101 = DSM 11237]GBQ31976.1 hypothetical protein AA11237_0028 [Acidocella aminolytica 101 = DSM 11237]